MQARTKKGAEAPCFNELWKTLSAIESGHQLARYSTARFAMVMLYAPPESSLNTT